MTDPTPRTPFARLGGYVIDAAALAGVASITYGVALFSRPAAFIVAGAFLLAGAWLTARRAGA